MNFQDQEKLAKSAAAHKLSTGAAIRPGRSVGRLARLVLMALVATLCAASAWAQNTQVTFAGNITSAGSVPGIAVGDKYSMVVYYNPSQAPSSTIGSNEAYYSSYTLNAVVYDSHGNQNFSVATNELLFVQDAPGSNEFLSAPCCGSKIGRASCRE